MLVIHAVGVYPSWVWDFFTELVKGFFCRRQSRNSSACNNLNTTKTWGIIQVFCSACIVLFIVLLIMCIVLLLKYSFYLKLYTLTDATRCRNQWRSPIPQFQIEIQLMTADRYNVKLFLEVCGLISSKFLRFAFQILGAVGSCVWWSLSLRTLS